MRFFALLLTLLTLAATALTACGDSDEATSSSEAASLVPTDAVVYAEATIKPEGDQKQQLEDLLAKFPGGKELGSNIADKIDEATMKPGDKITFKDDVQPWLGEQAALFVGGFGVGSEPRDIGVLLATDDEEASLDAVKKSEPKAKEASYEGVDYLTFSDDDGDPVAAGTLDGQLVFGTVSAFKAVVSASKGDGLAGTDGYQQALEDAAADRLGLVYVDMKAVADLIARMPGGGQQALKGLKGLDKPVVATISADSDGAEIAATVQASGNPFGAVAGSGSDLIGDVPADAWLALGQPDLGKALDAQVDQLQSTLGSRDQIEQQLRAATGLSLEEAIGWMGDFAIFVRGESVDQLNGALVAETTNPDDSAKLLQAVQRLARTAGDGTQVRPLGIPGDGFQLTSPDLPQSVYAYQRDGRVVIAYGEAAAKDALDPPSKLVDSEEYKAASDSLGEGYSASTYVAIAPILQLVESTPAAEDAEWAEVKRYLEPLGALVSGAKEDGDKVSSALRITVP
jgi:Protein of unknown function (DUF3352)